MMNFFFLLIFFGMYSLCLIRKHIFLCLISLELVIIYLMVMFYYFFSLNFNYMYMYIIMMSFFVCEGVLGLGVIVLLVRCHSNDYLNSMMMW